MTDQELNLVGTLEIRAQVVSSEEGETSSGPKQLRRVSDVVTRAINV